MRQRVEQLSGAGTLAPGPDVATGRAGDREHGAEVALYCRIAAGRVVEAKFRAFGCPHFIAAASWLTDRLRGTGREQFASWDWREAAEALEVPPVKFGRLLTLQDAVRDAARNWPGGTASTV